MQRKLIIILSSVTLIVALVSIGLRFRPAVPAIDRAPIIGAATGIGTVLAEETLKAIQNQGRIVLVTDYDHSRSDRGRDYRWETFQAEIKKQNAVSIAATEIAEADPNEPMVSSCPSRAFKAILDRHPAVAAIVFFIDLPEWAKVAAIIPRPVGPKIIGVDNMSVPTMVRYSGYFSSGTLTALIAPQSVVGSSNPPSKSQAPREWFEQYYLVYTQQNYESFLE